MRQNTQLQSNVASSLMSNWRITLDESMFLVKQHSTLIKRRNNTFVSDDIIAAEIAFSEQLRKR